jgi:hypothetical protein
MQLSGEDLDEVIELIRARPELTALAAMPKAQLGTALRANGVILDEDALNALCELAAAAARLRLDRQQVHQTTAVHRAAVRGLDDVDLVFGSYVERIARGLDLDNVRDPSELFARYPAASNNEERVIYAGPGGANDAQAEARAADRADRACSGSVSADLAEGRRLALASGDCRVTEPGAPA